MLLSHQGKGRTALGGDPAGAGMRDPAVIRRRSQVIRIQGRSANSNEHVLILDDGLVEILEFEDIG